VTARITALLFVAGAALTSACAGEPRAASATPATTGVVDSALPIPVLLDRFRATIPDTPVVLRGGAASPRALAASLLAALSAADTAAADALLMSQAEFAWLYYPHTKFTAPPYELGPEIAWLLHRAGSDKGALRLFRRFGGSSLRLDGISCPDSVVEEGPNRLIEGCRVRFAAGDSSARELQLFGALLNRDGQYKFLSYANDL
jgi:hypothetical protein